MTSRVLAAGLFLTGLMLVQASWILATPPFRGIDEFDHAFRAASVAQGQLRPFHETVRDGRGDYVRVPREIVEDAGPVCSDYAYTGPDNCSAVEDLGQDVKVASAAARYHPAYYAVVGRVASSWQGADFVYAARWTTAILCLGIWGLAVTTATRHRRHLLWPMALVCTPVLVYSQSILAPNGIEMAAAVLVWVTFLTMDTPASIGSERRRLLLVAAAAAVLVTVRTLGPLWLLLIVATLLCLPGRSARLAMLRRHRTYTAGAVVTVGLATLASALWVLSARTNTLTEESVYDFDDPWLNALADVPLWLFQSIAAFPTRGEGAPVLVYAAVLAVMTVAFLLASGITDRQWRRALLAMTAVWLLPPLVVTGLTYEASGALWQGRYSLPYSVGLPLVLLAWSSGRSRPTSPRLVVVGLAGLGYLVAHTVSVGNVLRNELADSPLSGDDRWITAPEPAVWALAALGSALMFCAPAIIAWRAGLLSEPAGARESIVAPG